MADGPWRIYLLGRLQARDARRTLVHFSARRTGALLACLVLRAPQPVDREELLELLWPEGDPEASRNRLRALLSSLRHQLGPGATGTGSLLLADRKTVRLQDSAFTSDYEDFLQALRSARATTNGAESVERLESALALYQGDLLMGFYDDWILAERRRLADLRYQTLRDLANRLASADRPERAVEYACQAVAIEPLDEEAHCDLIRLYGELGQPSAGLRQYEQLKRLLQEELQAAPSDAARRLAAEMEAKLGHGVASTRRSVRPMALRAPERAAQDQVLSNGLPLRLTRFFGRDAEISTLCSLLAPDEITRLVTVVGPGGTGKTRLSIEAADRLSFQYAGRAHFVSLGDVHDANDFGRAIAHALHLAPNAGLDHLSQAMAALEHAPALLILDNLEQIVADAAPQIARLLSEVPSLRCLVTSRQTLGIDGERELALRPLPLPRTGLEVEELISVSAVALFVDRARSVRSDFALNARNAQDVAELCHLLEGLPLAIELAAARTRVMTPAEMRDHTDKLMGWLVDVRGGKVARHRSLRATLEWSYRLLAPGERRYFNALAVFADGFTADAACAVALGEGAESSEFLATLEHLCDASMLTAVETTHGRTRFRILDMLREFGLERLAESGEEKPVRGRHLAYFCDFVCREDAQSFRWNPGEIARIATDDANLRAALEFGLRAGASEDEQNRVLDMASRLSEYWEALGRLAEGRAYLRRVIALPIAADAPVTRIDALMGAGILSSLLGDYGEAHSLLSEGIEAARASAIRRGIAGCASGLGTIAFAQADYTLARTRYQEALDIYQEIGDCRGIAAGLSELGNVAFYLGDHDTAQNRLETALALYRNADDPQGQASVLLRLGNVLRNQNRFVEGRGRLEEALTLFREVGNSLGIGSSLQGLGLVATGQMDAPGAIAFYTEALDLFREIGYLRGQASCLHYMGWAWLTRCGYVESRDCTLRSLELCRRIGDQRIMASCLTQIGNLAYEQGDAAESLARYTEALKIEREIVSPLGISNCLVGLARLAVERGDLVEACLFLSELLQSVRQTGVRFHLISYLETFAVLAEQRSQSALAVRFMSAASSIRKHIGASCHIAEGLRHESFLSDLRAELGEIVFAREWQEGEALSSEEAIAMSLNACPTDPLSDC